MNRSARLSWGQPGSDARVGCGHGSYPRPDEVVRGHQGFLTSRAAGGPWERAAGYEVLSLPCRHDASSDVGNAIPRALKPS